mgnify:CR=1 FL=1
MRKKKGPTWWKMFEFQRPVIESVSDADAGKGLKAAFQYFSGEDVDELTLTQGAFSVFSVIPAGRRKTDSPPIPPYRVAYRREKKRREARR